MCVCVCPLSQPGSHLKALATILKLVCFLWAAAIRHLLPEQKRAAAITSHPHTHTCTHTNTHAKWALHKPSRNLPTRWNVCKLCTDPNWKAASKLGSKYKCVWPSTSGWWLASGRAAEAEMQEHTFWKKALTCFCSSLQISQMCWSCFTMLWSNYRAPPQSAPGEPSVDNLQRSLTICRDY